MKKIVAERKETVEFFLASYSYRAISFTPIPQVGYPKKKAHTHKERHSPTKAAITRIAESFLLDNIFFCSFTR
jgi:hypothetical protein